MFSALGDGRAEASLIASSRYKDFPRELNSMKEENEQLAQEINHTTTSRSIYRHIAIATYCISVSFPSVSRKEEVTSVLMVPTG
jgi:hypothetical protein